MRTLLLAGTSLLALSASVAATAAPFFDGTPGFATFTVPTTGTYDIVATGAEGGLEHWTFHHDSSGGAGAQVGATFDLTQNEVLSIAVGAGGGNGPEHAYGGAGGGGGTFVLGPSYTPLLIAGGGGGGGGGVSQDGVSAQDSLAGTNGNGYHPGQGGSGGAGGGGGGAKSNYDGGGGGGGGGFKSNGGIGSGYYAGRGGVSFAGGLSGGSGGAGGPYVTGNGAGGAGGFGGGGGGAGGYVVGGSYGGSGGGGGGYSGGGGGGYIKGKYGGEGGGAGGSFLSGIDQNFKDVTLPTGDGAVTITYLSGPTLSRPAPVPEPASFALFGTGALGLLVLRRHRPRRR